MFMESALGRKVRLEVMEDNAQVMVAAAKGYSPALRHVSRTERVCTGVVHEVFYESDEISADLIKVETAKQKGGLFTKKIRRPENDRG